MNGVGHQFVEQELGLLGDKNRFLRDDVVGEVFLDFGQVPFDGDDVLLEESGQVTGDVLVDPAQGRLRRFGHREHAIHCL